MRKYLKRSNKNLFTFSKTFFYFNMTLLIVFKFFFHAKKFLVFYTLILYTALFFCILNFALADIFYVFADKLKKKNYELNTF